MLSSCAAEKTENILSGRNTSAAATDANDCLCVANVYFLRGGRGADGCPVVRSCLACASGNLTTAIFGDSAGVGQFSRNECDAEGTGFSTGRRRPHVVFTAAAAMADDKNAFDRLMSIYISSDTQPTLMIRARAHTHTHTRRNSVI